MNDLAITVIIPVRNGVGFISSALDSVFNQTSPPEEVIVVEDGSTDGTFELIAKNYGSRVTIIPGPQTGAGPARNLGVNNSKTNLIAFLDADDVWHPEKLARQLAEFKTGTVLGTYSDYFVDTKRGKRFFGTSIRSKNDSESTSMIKRGAALPALLSTWLFERDTFVQVNGFDAEYVHAQDFELALRMASSGLEFRVIREVFCDYRIHQSSASFTHYVSQKAFADYSRYKIIDGGLVGLESWKESFWTAKSQRQARAGFYFRLGLGSLGQTIPLKAMSFMLFSLALDPKGFANKFKSQSSLRRLFQ